MGLGRFVIGGNLREYDEFLTFEHIVCVMQCDAVCNW